LVLPPGSDKIAWNSCLPNAFALAERGRRARPLDRRKSTRYRVIDTTIAMVSNAIVAIKTLWPQRAINPSMSISR
jgi:hypothetical protein